MNLSHEQLTILFNEYLRYVLIGSTDHHPIFNSRAGGLALTKRLYAVLKKWPYLVHNDKVDVEALFYKLDHYFNRHKGVGIYIVGLNHWFTVNDLKLLRGLCELNFID